MDVFLYKHCKYICTLIKLLLNKVYFISLIKITWPQFTFLKYVYSSVRNRADEVGGRNLKNEIGPQFEGSRKNFTWPNFDSAFSFDDNLVLKFDPIYIALLSLDENVLTKFDPI